MLEITIDVLKQVAESNNRLAAAIEKMGNPAMVTPALIEEAITPAVTASTAVTSTATSAAPDAGAVPSGMPDFVNDDQKREWLKEQLISLGWEIPPRTRTPTMEKKWLELTAVAPAAGKVVGKIEPATAPADSPPPAQTEAPKYTKAQVTNVLREFVTGAADEATRNKNRDEVRTKLTEFGAANVTELKEADYAAVFETFKKE